MLPGASGLGTGTREPALAGFIVDRDRLVNAVVGAPRAAQIALRAPPGAGKTVLLAQLAQRLRASGEVVAWLGLEAADNDPGHLLPRILDAIAEGLFQAGETTGELARMIVPPDPIDGGFLASVVHALPAEPLWLLLDDMHVLDSARAADALARVIDAAGGRLRTVSVSRSVPLLPVPRRVLAGEAVELDADSLLFDAAEARALFQAHGVRLDDGALSAVLERTEGWAAGLRLAALSLARYDDPARFVASFTGDWGPVADYLVSEVLRGLPTHVTDVMLATSGPAELTVELAAVLSGRADAGAILDQLCRNGVLTTRAETTPPTYRYHALLREYLAGAAAARDLKTFRWTHTTAAAHYDRLGDASLALQLAVLGQDWAQVTDLLRRHGLPLALRGRQADVAAAVERLPPEPRGTPYVLLLRAMFALQDGAVGTGIGLLDSLPDLSAQPGPAAFAAALRLNAARLTGTGDARLAALVAAPRMDDGSVEALLLAATRGVGRMDLGDLAGARAELSPALGMALDRGYDSLGLQCLSRLAMTAATAGSPDMLDHAEAAIAFAAQRGWQRTAALRPCYFIAAWARWGALDSERAERNLGVAETVAGVAEPSVALYISLLRAYLDADRAGSAAGLGRRVRDTWAGADETMLGVYGLSPLSMIDLGYAEVAGDTEWLHETVARAERRLAGTGDLQVVRAWQLLVGDDAAGARDALEPVLQGRLPACDRAMSAGWLLECRAAAVLGRISQAHDALLTVLDLAERRSLLHPLVHAPPEVRRMLLAGRGRFGAHEDFVDRVLREVRLAPDRVDSPTLTGREVTILRDLPSLLSLADIAAAHQVSENTVKTHVRSIYDKLDVHTRRQAVQRANELGLL